jgi:fumarylpyruvate hydrolase
MFPVRQASLPLLKDPSKVFFIHRIYCIGRNYRQHAVEMGHDPDREPPFFFQKPPDAATTSSQIPYPSQTKNFHFEAELVVALGKEGRNLESLEAANDLIFGYSIGCDLTRRDLQAEAKKLSRPWDAAKGFDYSAPMTPLVLKEDVDLGGLLGTPLELWVNGDLKQSAPLSQMIWSIPETVQHISRYYTLLPGDLIMTGTPAGVGKLDVGDKVQITCGSELPECCFEVIEPLQ